MYHTKEILDVSAPPFVGRLDETDPVFIRDALEKKRFGDLAIGDRFVFDNQLLVKTGDYAATQDKKLGKSQFLFFKKDIVKAECTKLDDASSKEDIIDCAIIIQVKPDIIQVKPTPVLSVRENGKIISSQNIDSDIHQSWNAPVKLRGIDMILTYDGKHRFILSHNNEEVWSTFFHYNWDYVEACNIKINTITVTE